MQSSVYTASSRRPGSDPAGAQAREAAIGTGLATAAEMDGMLTLLEDPASAISSPTMFTAWGRRPLAP